MPLPTLQIVCGALLAGLALFIGVAHAVPHFAIDLSMAGQAPVLRIVWLGMALGNLLSFALVRRGQLRCARARVEATDVFEQKVERVRASYAQTTLVGCALAEGTGLLGVVVALLSHQPTDFWLAGVPLLAFAVLFPTQARLERYADAIL